MLQNVYASKQVSLYRRTNPGQLVQLIATAPETRSICNDPHIAGIQYTRTLQKACAAILKAGKFNLVEKSTVVVNILRGGLNFGLRDALCDAYGWNLHTTCFLSAQRARNEQDPESWHITENAYRKLYFPRETSLVLGDVVATGTSLRYALAELIQEAKNSGTSLKNIIFFTYGGEKAAEILNEMDLQCRKLFPSFQETVLIYLEGCFTVPAASSPLTIRLTGTDLVRRDSEMAPEFIESQYENPAYPLERCTIYDAGSRAFRVQEYAEDVVSYWKQVLELVNRGITFREYLKERFPVLDPARFEDVSLRDIALRQIESMKKLI